MNNAYLFSKLVDAQQAKYKAEEELLHAIENWFNSNGINVRASLLDYNYVRIYSRDDNMCNFDMTAFCDEFDAEVDFYKHGWQYIKYRIKEDEPNIQITWVIEVRQRSD